MSADNMYSMEESAHNKGVPKRKKITKGAGKGITKKMWSFIAFSKTAKS